MRNHRFLIVEDEDEWQEQFERACIERGFTSDDIRVAGDKATALVALEQWEPDIVILDLRLPSRTDVGDVDVRHGRDILGRIHELDKERLGRTVVLIVSGTIDDYGQQQYEEDPCVLRAINKADIGDALPRLVKRAEKSALRVYRDLHNHWPDMLQPFERIMNDATPPGDVLKDASTISNAMLQDIGKTLMGSSYPITPREDSMFERIHVLRGGLSKLDTRSRCQGKESTEIWIDGIIYQHLETIRNYANCRRHFPSLMGTPATPDHRCLLDSAAPAEMTAIEELDDMVRLPAVLRPIMLDLLDWYLPWKRKQGQSP